MNHAYYRFFYHNPVIPYLTFLSQSPILLSHSFPFSLPPIPSIFIPSLYLSFPLPHNHTCSRTTHLQRQHDVTFTAVSQRQAGGSETRLAVTVELYHSVSCQCSCFRVMHLLHLRSLVLSWVMVLACGVALVVVGVVVVVVA